MNKALLLSLSLFLVALSGCTDDSGAADDLKEEFKEESGETGGESSESGEETGAEETLDGTMSISFGADQSVGQAPFTVRFNILAKAINVDGTEDTNASIDWAIFDSEGSSSGLDEFGEGGNATVNFTFTNPGVFEIAAGVSADGFESAFATVSINVTDAPVVVKNPQVASGIYTVTTPVGCALTGGSAYDGIYQGRMTLEQRVLNGKFSATITVGSIGDSLNVILSAMNSGGIEQQFTGVSGEPIEGNIGPGVVGFVFQSCGLTDETSWEITATEP